MKRALALALLALTGCGAQAPDLFEVDRSGQGPNADVRMVVSDAGTVQCNRQPQKALPGKKLLDARQLARDLDKQATLSIDLPPQPDSVLRYVVRTDAGRVAFSDNSRDKPPAFDQVMAFTKDVVEDVCGISR